MTVTTIKTRETEKEIKELEKLLKKYPYKPIESPVVKALRRIKAFVSRH